MNQSRIKIKCIELWFEPDSQTQEPIIIARNKLNHIMEMSKRNYYQSQLSSNSHDP